MARWISWPAGAVLGIMAGTANAGPATRAEVEALLPAFEAYARSTIDQWQTPGVAIGIVAGDELVYAKGFGVRRLGGQDPVDADTVFQIGSTTKAFAATTEAILVGDGKLGWMDRVIDRDPTFRLFDPWATREFRIIDLLSQRSGLAPYALGSMAGLGYSRDQMLEALRQVEPATSFRAVFGYQNVLHLEAERMVVGASGAASWEAFLAERILQPLQMTSTTATEDDLLKAPNHAAGHRQADGSIGPVPPMPNFYRVGAAGNMNSSVRDMSRWLRMQINEGELEGRRIVDKAALDVTHTPQVPISAVASYASGWVVSAKPGGRVIWHNGNTPGFAAHVGFDPERRAGIVVLTNLGGKGAPGDAIAMRFYDLLQGNPEKNYSAEMLATADATIAADTKEFLRPEPALPPRPLEDYAGDYRSPLLGAGSIAVEAGQLQLPLGPDRLPTTLKPWSGDIFTWHMPPGPMAEAGGDPAGKVRFETGPDGRISGFKVMPGGDPVAYAFTRDPS